MNEAELLLSRILDKDRFSLYLDRGMRLEKEAAALLSSVLKRRVDGEPLAYCLGKADFFGLEFNVTPAVLVPRPETEILVEKALSFARGRSGIKILDLGTGSGCIAVVLAKELALAKVDALDFSYEALEVARENARLNNVKINFILGDLFSAQGLEEDSYDIIVSNPPYIPTAEIDKLQIEVRLEPRMALDGGLDGLDFYRRIAQGATAFLKKDGLLIMEMGHDQRQAIERIFQRDFKVIEVARDYSGIDRVIVIKRT